MVITMATGLPIWQDQHHKHGLAIALILAWTSCMNINRDSDSCHSNRSSSCVLSTCRVFSTSNCNLYCTFTRHLHTFTCFKTTSLPNFPLCSGCQHRNIGTICPSLARQLTHTLSAALFLEEVTLLCVTPTGG